MNLKKNLPLLIVISLSVVLILYILQHRYTLAAVFYQTLQQHDRAIDNFMRAIEHDQRNTYAYYQLGLIYKERKEFINAENIYLKLLKIFPEHPYINYDLGYVYREMKLYEKALDQYKKALEIDPNKQNSIDRLKKLEKKK